MTYNFKSNPPEVLSDLVIATATNGVVYTENNRLHIKNNKKHIFYKYDGQPVGWYQRNIKTLDDVFLGQSASPTIELETLNIKDGNTWENIIDVENENVEE